MNDSRLLEILLPEVEGVGLHELEKLQHHGRDAPEMSGTFRPFPEIHQGSRIHGRGEPGRIERSDAGQEEPVRPRVAAETDVPDLVARIAREILRRSELERIHEDRNRHPVVLAPGAADQGEVSFVQGSHGRHETHGHAALARAARKRAQLSAAGHDLHGFLAGFSGDAA